MTDSDQPRSEGSFAKGRAGEALERGLARVDDNDDDDQLARWKSNGLWCGRSWIRETLERVFPL